MQWSRQSPKASARLLDFFNEGKNPVSHFYASVAQLVKHRSCKAGSVSSNLTGGSMNNTLTIDPVNTGRWCRSTKVNGFQRQVLSFICAYGVSGQHSCLPSRWGGFESHYALHPTKFSSTLKEKPSRVGKNSLRLTNLHVDNQLCWF